jgi:hypothetical protein
MTNAYAKTLYKEAQQTCLDLGLSPTLGSARRVLKTGKTSIKSMSNYYVRREVLEIADKPYTNEYGQQEPFGDICERNLEYAEMFVERNMNKFQGGVRNMTEASRFVIQEQRKQIKKLKANL